jgi:hypothetical protein
MSDFRKKSIRKEGIVQENLIQLLFLSNTIELIVNKVIEATECLRFDIYLFIF